MGDKKKKDSLVVMNPEIDAGLFLMKMEGLIEESTSIANYIGGNVKYGRALGFAEGRYSAYVEILERVINGEFDRSTLFEQNNEEG